MSIHAFTRKVLILLLKISFSFSSMVSTLQNRLSLFLLSCVIVFSSHIKQFYFQSNGMMDVLVLFLGGMFSTAGFTFLKGT